MTAPTYARRANGSVDFPMRLLTGLDAIRVHVLHRMRTSLGSALEDAARGLPWYTWFNRPAIPLVEIQAAVRRQLLLVDGVVGVDSVTATRAAGALSIACRVRVSVGGQALSTELVIADPYQTSGPLPWFQITQMV